MVIDLIGIGMDGAATRTQEAQDAIAKAELLIGASRMLETVPEDGRERLCAYDAQEIADYVAKSSLHRAAVLLSGDSGFFSGARKLTQALAGHSVRLIPGISSAAYFCAKAAIPWEAMHFVSLHGVEGNIAVHVRSHAHTFFLLGGDLTAAQVCRRLCEYGLGAVKVYIGERLGYADERILSGTAQELINCETARLCVMIAENPDFCDFIPTCIPDAAFERSSVPMTKAEVRGIAVSSLEIRRGETCWDIGCGTGSVSVEMALRCPEGTVYALDHNAEAVRLTHENARRFACDNIRVLTGTAPEALDQLPPPDKVFLGGTGGRMDEIFQTIAAKNPAARITVSAVTLETLHAAQAAFAGYPGTCSITQIAVTQTRSIGGYTMLQANNPVFLLCGTLQ